VTSDGQAAFDAARNVELVCQAVLVSRYLDIEKCELRDISSELLLLRAKMVRAQAEIKVYTLAIENAHAFDRGMHELFICYLNA
jgi:hypothetical protein